MMRGKLKIGCLVFFSVFISMIGNTQEIILSKAINYDSNDGFLLMGEAKDTLMLFHEDGTRYNIQVFNRNLDYLFTKELIFEKPNIRFNLIQMRDEDFTIIYSYEDRFSLKMVARKYDLKGNVIDSVGIFDEKDYLNVRHFSFVLSEDKNKVMLFRTTEFEFMEFVFFDLERNQQLWHKKIKFENFELPNQLKGLLLTNRGELILAFEKYNFSYRRNKHYQRFYVIDPYTDLTTEHSFPFRGNLSVSFNFEVDEKNDQIVVAGLYSQKSNSRAAGYYLYKFNRTGVTQNLVFEEFPNKLFIEFSGRKRNPKKYIPDLEVKDLVLRNDGGLVIISEMQKEVQRESVRRRYIDYHYEDIILLGVHPEGDLFWNRLIRKYQLSYDDNARFSSYFLFRNPSTLRVVFNDEIKSENTISEFLINPLGQGKRNALFATDLHKLKLAFKEGIQISSDTFIVPSRFNNEYRIIKIGY
jgi:hypothetical protein